jgi:hypothetical protein
MWDWMYRATFLDLDTCWSSQLHAPAALPSDKKAAATCFVLVSPNSSTPENVQHIRIRNVGLSPDYTALYPRTKSPPQPVPRTSNPSWIINTLTVRGLHSALSMGKRRFIKLEEAHCMTCYSKKNSAVKVIFANYNQRWTGHVARRGEKRNPYRLSVGKPEESTTRPRRRWVDNINIDLKIGRGGMDWIDLAQYMDHWRALVNTVINLRVPQNVGWSYNSCTTGGFSRWAQIRVSYKNSQYRQFN